MSNLIDVESTSHFQTLLSEDLNRVSLINFWAKWAPSCTGTNEVVQRLAENFPQILVLQVRFSLLLVGRCCVLCLILSEVEAEEQVDIAESFDIDSVPVFVILRVCP